MGNDFCVFSAGLAISLFSMASLTPSTTPVCQFYMIVYVVIKQIRYIMLISRLGLAFRGTRRIPIGLCLKCKMKRAVL